MATAPKKPFPPKPAPKAPGKTPAVPPKAPGKTPVPGKPPFPPKKPGKKQ